MFSVEESRKNHVSIEIIGHSRHISCMFERTHKILRAKQAARRQLAVTLYSDAQKLSYSNLDTPNYIISHFALKFECLFLKGSLVYEKFISHLE